MECESTIFAVLNANNMIGIATSAVSKSKINEAVHNGEATIPFVWATDIEGKSTYDPLGSD